MSDPRASIPDTVITAADGTQWLTRSRQLVVTADRDGPISITIEAQVIPCAGVDADGKAQTYPSATAINGSFHYTLADVPQELAAPLAMWLAQQAGVNGPKILAPYYPAPESAP